MPSDIIGLDRLVKKLTTLQKFQDKMVPPTEKAIALLHEDMGKTPVKAAGAFTRLATPAQRRAYWARVRAGEINHRDGVGYVRSNVLQQGYRERVQKTSSGVKGTLENPVKYAHYVQGDRQQSFHAASKWRKTKDAVKDNADKIKSFYEDAANREIRK